jgi:glycosyltransferase involved in cell wall biosynthesis
MPKVSVNILTKNRAPLLKKTLASVAAQSFADFEVVVVDDGSTDGTSMVLESFKQLNIQTIKHPNSIGITKSRQETLLASKGEYVAVLDDDDEWLDKNKLDKQVQFLDSHPEVVLCGGGIKVTRHELQMTSDRFRPQADAQIRRTMLFCNNFFTSTVMFRRQAAVLAGGFVSDGVDLAEDYDLWLRMGKLGKFYNFREVFTLYSKPQYNKEKFKQFLAKQLELIGRYKNDHPYYHTAAAILWLRLKFLIPNS